MNNNRASIYGHDFASFPREIYFIQNEEDYIKYFERKSTEPISVNQTLTTFIFDNV